MFTIKAAEYLGLGKGWDYGQQHMNNIRMKMVSQILAGKVEDPAPE